MMKSLSASLLAATLLCGTAQAQTAPASFGHYQPAATYDGMVSTSRYVEMRDGVKLAIRVDRPTRDGKPVDGRFPVIWHHTLSISQQTADGAGGRVSGFRQVQDLTRYGYVVVQVARRGNGQSTGVRRGYHDRNEAQDAFDMTQWLAAQPWSDGKVGVYGCSNTGDAAMHVMTMRPPALKAVFAGCFSWNKYDAFRRGGIFAQWGTGPTRTVEDDMKVSPVDGDEQKIVLRQAAEEHQLSTPLFDMWKQLPYRDSWSSLVASRFWAEGSASSYADQIRLGAVPLYIQGGWRDELRDQGFIAHANIPGSRLVIGPWKHCNSDDFALLEEMHRFYDRHLKGIDTGIDRDAPIHYFTVNAAPGTEWRASADWPLKQTRMQRLFLDGTRLSEKAGRSKPLTFTADYTVKCPGAGEGSQVQPCHVAGSGASLSGAPLAADTEVTGNALADLWISADQSDANVFAYLEDVAPDGTVQVVTEGRLKASLRKEAQAPWAMPPGVPWHRSYQEDAQPLKAGEPVRLRFDMMPTSWLFRKGHRMQITVTGSDHRERARDIAAPPRITVYFDRAHPSTVSLPIIPATPN
jgi:putative CocE/NonD family hydrolase